MSLHIDPYHDWQFLYSRCNWYDFTLIRAVIENDWMFGNFEVDLAILGLGVRVTWHYKDTGYADKLRAQIDSLDR